MSARQTNARKAALDFIDKYDQKWLVFIQGRYRIARAVGATLAICAAFGLLQLVFGWWITTALFVGLAATVAWTRDNVVEIMNPPRPDNVG